MNTYVYVDMYADVYVLLFTKLIQSRVIYFKINNISQ